MKKIILLASFILLNNYGFTQNSSNPLSQFTNPVVHSNNDNNSKKPTGDLQRCIATSNYVFGNKIDTLGYTYSSERGTVPNMYGTGITSQYDTFYNTVNNGTSFFVDHVRSYTSEDKISNVKYYNNAGDYLGYENYFYNQNGTDSLYIKEYKPNATDSSYQTKYFNADGLLIADTLYQHVQSTPFYDMIWKRSREYDNQSRNTKSYSYNYSYTNDHLTIYDVKHYYENNTTTLSNLDSTTAFVGTMANPVMTNRYEKHSYNTNGQLLADSLFNAVDDNVIQVMEYSYVGNTFESTFYSISNNILTPSTKTNYYINNNGDTLSGMHYATDPSNNMILYSVDSFEYDTDHFQTHTKLYQRHCDNCILYLSDESDIIRNNFHNPISINSKKYSESGNGTVINNVDDYFYYMDNAETGIIKIADLENISIYPIPTHGNLFIDMTKLSSTPSYLKIVDAFGRKISDRKLTTTKETLNVESLSPGMYLLQFYDKQSNMLYSKKIIKG